MRLVDDMREVSRTGGEKVGGLHGCIFAMLAASECIGRARKGQLSLPRDFPHRARCMMYVCMVEYRLADANADQ